MADPVARLAVRLTPGAAVDRIDGWDVDAEERPVLKARVRARAVEGAANAALLALLSETLDVPKSAVSLERGGQSRVKMILVRGRTIDDLRSRLTDL